MGNNSPLGNTNNARWNLPPINPNAQPVNNQPTKPSTSQSGFPDIDAFLKTTTQYANNTVNTMGPALTAAANKLNNNQNLDTQSLFSLTGASQTAVFNNTVILGNTIESFTSNTATSAAAGVVKTPPENQQQSLWASVISANGSVLPITEEDKTPTNKPQTVADILKTAPNAVAGPTQAVFGRANNFLGLQEATTQTNNPAFINDLSAIAGLNTLSKGKTAAFTMLSTQYPELAELYTKDTATKADQLATQGADATTNQATTANNNFPTMPSAFNTLYNVTIQQGKADDMQRAATMKLVADAQKLASRDMPKN